MNSSNDSQDMLDIIEETLIDTELPSGSDFLAREMRGVITHQQSIYDLEAARLHCRNALIRIKGIVLKQQQNEKKTGG